ncbi:unnamed protein product, partial [Staurois parvus]
MSILTCCVQWLCTEQSRILLFLGLPQALLAPPSCRVPPQQAACYGGNHCSMCPFTHGAAAQPCLLSLLMGSLTVIDSNGSQWLLLLSQPMRRGSPRLAKTRLHITGSRGLRMREGKKPLAFTTTL